MGVSSPKLVKRWKNYYGWVIFAALTLTFIFSYFIRLSTGVLGPDLMRDLEINASQLGMLAGAFFYAFGVAQIPVGLALDSFSPKRVIISTAFFAVPGCFLMGVAKDFQIALIGRILIGFGMSSVLMGSLKIFNNWFRPDQFAFLAGFTLSLGNFGALVAAAPLVFMSTAIGWRHCFLVFAVFVLLMMFLIFFVVVDYPPKTRTSKADKISTAGSSVKSLLSPLRIVFSSRHFWLIALSSFIRYGSLISIQGFLGMLYLVEMLGYSAQKSGNILSMISIGYLVGGPIAGRLSDTFFRSRKKVMLMGLFSSAILTLCFLLQGVKSSLLWYTVFFGLGFSGSIGSVGFAHAKELFPKEIAGVALTSTNLFVMAGAAVTQHVMGFILGEFPKTSSGYPPEAYQFAFTVLFAMCLIASSVYIMVKDTNPSLSR